MKIDYSRTEYISADIPASKILEAAIKLVELDANIDGCWLKDGKVCYEAHTSHSYDTDRGLANEDELKAFEVSSYLRILKSIKERKH